MSEFMLWGSSVFFFFLVVFLVICLFFYYLFFFYLMHYFAMAVYSVVSNPLWHTLANSLIRLSAFVSQIFVSPPRDDSGTVCAMALLWNFTMLLYNDQNPSIITPWMTFTCVI